MARCHRVVFPWHRPSMVLCVLHVVAAFCSLPVALHPSPPPLPFQALGRVIRHRNDYGAIILCDPRFQSHKDNLSMWLRPHFTVAPTFADTLSGLTQFFKSAPSQIALSRRVDAAGTGGAMAAASFGGTAPPAALSQTRDRAVGPAVPMLAANVAGLEGADAVVVAARSRFAAPTVRSIDSIPVPDVIGASQRLPLSFWPTCQSRLDATVTY
jgi:hypothetical protein